MSDLDYSKLTDQQLLALKAAGGDLSKLSDDDLVSINSTLHPSLGRRALNALGDVASGAWTGLNTGINYTGTQAVKAAAGLGGIPRAAVDALDWAGIPPALLGPAGLPLMAGKNLPTSDEISSGFFKATGAPEVNSGNRTLDKAVQGLLSVPMTGGTSLPALAAGAAGGAGAELAGQATEGTPYEMPARVAGGLLGAAGGFGGAKLIGMGIKGVGAAREPFTEEGRDLILGRTLNRQASNPTGAAGALESYTPPVPGMNVDIGHASRDPGLMAMADIAPDQIRGPLVQQNNRLLTETIDRAGAGLPPVDQSGATIQQNLRTRFEQLGKARAAAAEPFYKEARSFPEDLPVGGLFKYADQTIAANKGAPQAAMQDVRRLLLDSKGRPDFSARGLMATRSAIGSMLESNPDNYTRSLLMTMRDKIDDVLASVPAEAAARAKFAEFSRPLEPFDAKLGDTNRTIASVIERDPYNKTFLMSPDRVPSTLMKRGDMGAPTMQRLLMASGGDPAVRQAMASAYFDDFKNAIGSSTARDAAGNPMLSAAAAERWLAANKGGAANVLTPDQVKAMETVRDALVELTQQVPGRVNSATYSRLATDNILSAMLGNRLSNLPVPNIIRNTIGMSFDVADEALRNRLFEVIQDPKAAAALMKKATPGNLKMVEPVLVSIGRGANPQAVKEQQ